MVPEGSGISVQLDSQRLAEYVLLSIPCAFRRRVCPAAVGRDVLTHLLPCYLNLLFLCFPMVDSGGIAISSYCWSVEVPLSLLISVRFRFLSCIIYCQVHRWVDPFHVLKCHCLFLVVFLFPSRFCLSLKRPLHPPCDCCHVL